MAIWSRLTSTIAGVAIGEAGAAVVEPALEVPRQKAWEENANRVLDLPEIARLVATGLTDEGAVVDEAKRNGYNEDRLRALIQLELHAPGIAQALELFRRNGIVPVEGQITAAQLEHAIAKAGVENQYHAAILALVQQPLEPAEIAKAIHRAIMPDDGLLIASPPSTPGHVKAIPPSPLDPIKEAAASGIDAERLRIMVGNAGLPLGLMEMLSLLNRGYMTTADVQRGIAESNLRNEYQDVALELARRLLTPTEYSELRLRGWITDQAGRDGAALSGMTGPDADLLYDMHGRPLVVHQVTTGIARGGEYDDPGKPDTPGTLRAQLVQQLQSEGHSLRDAHAYVDAVQESNIRPQFYALALANRFTLPGYFVVKAMLADGAITTDEAEGIFLQEGWRPDLAAKAAQALSPSGTTGKQLTTAQLRAAVASGQLTKPDALKRLEARGYSPEDAEIILDNPTRTPPAG